MSREFRAWDKINKCWLTDKDNVYLSEEGESFILVRGGASDFLSRVDVEMNFSTGLKDKNGTKIFEGDINSKGGICKYYAPSFKWGYGDNQPTEIITENDTVVGNMHQTPELLNT